MLQLAGQSRESMLDGYMSLRGEVGNLFVTIVRPMLYLFRKPRDSKLEKDIPPRGGSQGLALDVVLHAPEVLFERCEPLLKIGEDFALIID